MKRDYRKLTAEYKAKFFNKPISCRRGQIFLSDYTEILTLAKSEVNNTSDSMHFALTCIDIALQSGIMIGYKAHKADEKENRRKKKERRCSVTGTTTSSDLPSTNH